MKTLKDIKSTLNKFKKQSRPILNHAYVSDNKLTVTDLESYIVFNSSYNLNDGLYNIDTVEHAIASNIDISEYPTGPQFEVVDSVKFDVADLEYMLQFASKDCTRMNLNTITLDKTHAVATDGHTLVSKELKEHLDSTYLLPREALQIFVPLCKKFKVEQVFIELGEAWAQIKCEYFTYSMRLVQREFVRWQNIIPTKISYDFYIEKAPFKMADIKSLLAHGKGVFLDFKNGITYVEYEGQKIEYALNISESQDMPLIKVNAEYFLRIFPKKGP